MNRTGALAFALALGAMAHGSFTHAQPMVHPTTAHPAAMQSLFDEAAPAHGNVPMAIEVLAGARSVSVDAELATDQTYMNPGVTRMQLTAPAGTRRTIVAPVHIGYSRSLALTVGDERWDSASLPQGQPAPTFIAVAGVRPHIPLAALGNAADGTAAGRMRRDGQTGRTLWPGSMAAWGSVHVVLTTADAWLEADASARRAVSDLVLAGGALVISPRTTGDVREPMLAEMIGSIDDVAPSEPGTIGLRGRALTNHPYFYQAFHGLGTVLILRRDLTAPGTAADPEVQLTLGALSSWLGRRHGAAAPFGALQDDVEQRFDRGAIIRALYPKSNLRSVLLPVSFIYMAYVIGVAVLLVRERRRGTPMRLFTLVPIGAMLCTGIIASLGYVIRGGGSKSNSVVLYETASGATRGLRHVIAGITAGGPVTFDAVAPAGGSVMLHGEGIGRITRRWDGDRLSLEGVRIGQWDQATVAIDDVRTLRGTIEVRRENQQLVMVNRTPTRLHDAVYIHDDGMLCRFGPAAPGETVPCTELPPGAGSPVAMLGLTRSPVAAAIVEQLTGSATVIRDASELWAAADAHPSETDRLGPFGLTPETVLYRVVVRRFESGAAARSPTQPIGHFPRSGQQYGTEPVRIARPPEPEPAQDTETDAGAPGEVQP